MREFLKKRGLTFLLDAIFTVIAIGALYFSRIQLKDYIAQIENIGPQLYQLQTEAATNNISIESYNAFQQLTSMASGVTLINNILVPAILIFTFIITQMIVWKILNKIPMNRFAAYSLFPFAVFLLFGSMLLELLMYIIIEIEFNWVWFILLLIVFIVSSYFGLLWNVHWNENINKILRKKVVGSYLLFGLAAIFYLLMCTLAYVMLTVDSFSWIFAVLVLLGLIVVNYARTFYIRKAKSV